MCLHRYLTLLLRELTKMSTLKLRTRARVRSNAACSILHLLVMFAFPNVRRKPSGRISHFTQIKNYPVQSFATADIVPLILHYIENRLELLQSCIVNTVHDSIVIDVHPDEINKVVFILKTINQDINNIINNEFGIDFNVPLLLESKIGDNWLDTKDIN